MTAAEEEKLFIMIKEIYHHLGLDGQRLLSLNQVQEDAKKNILKWKDKRFRRNYVGEKSS